MLVNSGAAVSIISAIRGKNGTPRHNDEWFALTDERSGELLHVGATVSQ